MSTLYDSDLLNSIHAVYSFLLFSRYRPDVEGYRKKLQREQAEKKAAESSDNRSFLSKYVSVFFLISLESEERIRSIAEVTNTAAHGMDVFQVAIVSTNLNQSVIFIPNPAR